MTREQAGGKQEQDENMARAKKLVSGGEDQLAVMEEDGVRTLHIGGHAIQSALRLAAPELLELEYTRAMMAFLLFCPEPKDVLMIGLGGGSIARFVHARLPEARMTVVEISPGVVKVARHYFGLPEDDRRLRVIVADGAAWVQAHAESAEVLLLDGFEDGKQPAALCNAAFYENACKALRPGGIMAANFMAEDRRLDTYIAHIDKVFDGRTLLLSAEDNVNVIVLAFKGGAARISWETLRNRARAQQRALGLPTAYFLSTLREQNEHSANYLRIAAQSET